MKKSAKVRYLASAALLATLATPAVAQQAQSNTGDIIVTARRFEERLQDVPISMTVFDQQQLADRNVTTAADLATYTPSLAVDKRFGTDTASFAIRGFTKELRTTASVGVYFADVVAPRGGAVGTGGGDGIGPGAFFDLQNVQVLKGPQGTLFGRNTTGGAVLLVPRKPGRDFGGYIEGSLGNYDLKRIEAVVNLPVSEAVRLRLGVDHQQREGFLRNVSGVGPDDFADINYVAMRASLVVDLTPELENYTIGSYTDSDTHGTIMQVFAINPQSTSPIATILAAPQVARQDKLGFYDVQNSMSNARSAFKQWQVINTTTWKASDALTVKNIFSYGEYSSVNRFEVFGSNFITPAIFGPLGGIRIGFGATNPPEGTRISDQSTWTEELQLQGQAADGRLVWQLGGYYEKSKPLSLVGSRSLQLISCPDSNVISCTDVLGLAFGIPGQFGSLSSSYGRNSYRDYGIYGQATYSLTDQLKLTGGIRYTNDVSKGEARISTYRFPNPANPAQAVRTCVDPQASLANDCALTFTQRSDAPTWVVNLDYKPVDDIMVYAKWARGYRQGAVNAFGPSGFNTFGPEKVDLYEVGLKSTFRGALQGFFNVAAFYNDFRNQQLQVGAQSSTQGASATTAIVNAGKSRIWGIEVDSSLSPSDAIKFDVSYAYLNTKLLSTIAITAVPGSPYDIFSFTSQEGLPLPFTPKHKLSATATFKLPIPESIGDLRFAANYSYSSNYIVSSSSPFGRLGEAKLVNLNLNWSNFGGYPVDLAAFVTNLTKDKYSTYVIGTYVATGFDSRAPGEPRIWGLRLKWRFGGEADR